LNFALLLLLKLHIAVCSRFQVGSSSNYIPDSGIRS
jgi:hypothetical protein